MPFSAHDVAEELRRRLGNIGLAKLHKLLYYVQGWHLAWSGEPLFAEEVKAWANGPVVATLWADEKYNRTRPQSVPLDPTALATIDYVVERYGRLSGAELIKLSHLEDPWRDLSESEDPSVPADPEIRHEALLRWFRRDEDYTRHVADVERLGRRTDIYSFGPLARTPELEDAVARAVRGTRVRHSRPE